MSMVEPKDAAIFSHQQGGAAAAQGLLSAPTADFDEDAELQQAIALSQQALWQQGS
jgi:hypothetical protein